MLTSEAVELFLFSRLSKNDENSTIKWYRLILEYFSTIFPELPDKPEQVEHFLTLCKGGDERRHGFYRALKALYNFLERRYDFPNIINKIDPPKRRRKMPRTLTMDDLAILINYHHDPDTKVYLTFLIDTGCRPCELHGLKPEDITFTPCGYVARVNGKTGERLIPISSVTYHEIIKYIPIAFNHDWLCRKISKAFKDAGVPGTAYTLRHTFATLWDSSEFALQQIMGHTNFQTLKVYRNLRLNTICKLHDQFSPLVMLTYHNT